MLGALGRVGGAALGQPSCPCHTCRGLFKTDRVLGTAQLKLDALETACEVREILEVRRGHLSAGSGVALLRLT